jgi:hypothetical protein
VQAAYAAIMSSGDRLQPDPAHQVQLINLLNIEIEQLGEVVAAHLAGTGTLSAT